MAWRLNFNIPQLKADVIASHTLNRQHKFNIGDLMSGKDVSAAITFNV